MSYFLPTYEQLCAAHFVPDGSRSILDFTRHDKTMLTYGSLHSAQEPGRFALSRYPVAGKSEVVFRGTVATADAFGLLLRQHGWQPQCVPASWEFLSWHKKTYRPKPS